MLTRRLREAEPRVVFKMEKYRFENVEKLSKRSCREETRKLQEAGRSRSATIMSNSSTGKRSRVAAIDQLVNCSARTRSKHTLEVLTGHACIDERSPVMNVAGIMVKEQW